MKRICGVCYSHSNVESQKKIIIKTKASRDTELCDKIVCKYYSLSEVNSKAYERSCDADACFKGKYSCINCKHRFFSKEYNSFYCFFDYLDREKKEMYYLKIKNKSKDNIVITIRYWICPVCEAKNEISVKEKMEVDFK